MTLPITLADPHTAVLPHTYVIHHKSQRCAACGQLHSFSEIYAKTHLRSTHAAGKYITNLRPVHWPAALWNLPIETVHIKEELVPFCHACHAPSLAHWPSPPSSDQATCVGAHTYEPQAPAKPVKATQRKTTTLADVLDLL